MTAPAMESVQVGGVQAYFTREQAPGAWPNNSIVAKLNSQPGDATADGIRGRVIGSLDVREISRPAAFIYFVEWDTRRGLPVGCVDTNDDGSPRLQLMEARS